MRGDCMRAAAQEKEIICFYKIIIVTVLKNAGIAFPRFFLYSVIRCRNKGNFNSYAVTYYSTDDKYSLGVIPVFFLNKREK